MKTLMMMMMMPNNIEEMFTGMNSVGRFMFIWTAMNHWIPRNARRYVQLAIQKLINYVSERLFDNANSTIVTCSIQECTRTAGLTTLNTAYFYVEAYLSTHALKTSKLVRANKDKEENKLVISLDPHETVTEDYCGAKVTWSLTLIDDDDEEEEEDEEDEEEEGNKQQLNDPSIRRIPQVKEKCYVLMFDEVHRKLILDSYLGHVMKQGSALRLKFRKRMIFKNGYSTSDSLWHPVEFEHSANFDTLAMELEKKKEIMNDLRKFSASKDYYAKIGKAWKRGYLLYGPPGTGKSTMIAAMANFLDYDVYDLELTAVMNNADLFEHLIEISDKSILVIEDIDCSLDLTGQRTDFEDDDFEEYYDDDDFEEYSDDEFEEYYDDEFEEEYSSDDDFEDGFIKITLSGLLNFVDGIWSNSGGERIIVFTTNHLEKLDPALIRSGRMDKHIELSYCCFEAFKVLAKNYLDLESHPLFDTVKTLIEEINITPADVAENLMPKSFEDNVDVCLKNLIQALEATKAEESLKLEKEEEMNYHKRVTRNLELPPSIASLLFFDCMLEEYLNSQ